MINKYAELEEMSKIYKACSGILRVKLAEEAKPKRGSKWDSFKYNFNRSRAKTRNSLNSTIPVETNEKGTADALENLGKGIGDTIRAGHNFNRSITDTIGDTLYELPGALYETGKSWGAGLGRAGYGIGTGIWAGSKAVKDSLVDAYTGTKQIAGQLAGRAAGAIDRGLAGVKSIGGGALRGAKDIANASIVEPSVAYGKSWYHHPVTSLASLGLGGAAGYGTYKGIEHLLDKYRWDPNSWKTKALKWGGGIGAGLLTHLFTQGIMNRMADRAQGRALGAQQQFDNSADNLASSLLASSGRAREANNAKSDVNNPNNKNPLNSAMKRQHMKKNDTKSKSKPVNRKSK